MICFFNQLILHGSGTEHMGEFYTTTLHRLTHHMTWSQVGPVVPSKKERLYNFAEGGFYSHSILYTAFAKGFLNHIL